MKKLIFFILVTTLVSSCLGSNFTNSNYVFSDWIIVNQTGEDISLEFGMDASGNPSIYKIYADMSKSIYTKRVLLSTGKIFPFEYFYERFEEKDRIATLRDSNNNILHQWTWKEGAEQQDDFFNKEKWSLLQGFLKERNKYGETNTWSLYVTK